MTTTINLKLPEIAESQASKAITHNEALHILDALVNCAVIDRDLTAPPGLPVDGDVYIPKATATGAWAGKENQLAHYDVTAWKFYPPEEGWPCYVRDEDSLLVYTGSAWTVLAGAGLAPPFADTTALAKGSADASKQVRLEVDGLTTATTRVLTVPDADMTLGDNGYLAGSMYNGAPTASLILLHHVVTRTVIFPSGLSGSQGKAETAATAQTDFDILKNGSSVGTMRFAAAGTSASFIMASATTFAAGDILKVVSPASPDATLANITFTLAGTR